MAVPPSTLCCDDIKALGTAVDIICWWTPAGTVPLASVAISTLLISRDWVGDGSDLRYKSPAGKAGGAVGEAGRSKEEEGEARSKGRVLHTVTVNRAMVDSGRPTRAKGHQESRMEVSRAQDSEFRSCSPQEDWPG